MAQKLANRSAQYPLVAEFVFNYNDWVVDSVDQVKKTFGSTALLADPAGTVAGLTAGTGLVFDCIPMPLGAVIVGGEVIVETAYAGIGAGATLTLGIAGATTALLGSTDLDAATSGSRTALLLTAPLTCNGGQNIRLTTAGLTATATAGKVRIRVQFTLDGRAHEVVPN
jgi:hypothetical protein